MKIVVLGAGIIGVSTAWHLLQRGHDVVVVDRQPGAALETSHANGAQISVSFCEPWAHPTAPLKVLRWLTRDDAPLLFRPQLDWHQWRWGLGFLSQCTLPAFRRNVGELVALGRYSHDALKQIVADTGIEYHRLERGILHLFSSQQDLESGAAAAALMQHFGVDRRVLTREQVLAIEPSLRHFAGLRGGTYTPSDESGDAFVFTRALARHCADRGARFLYGRDILSLDRDGGGVRGVRVRDRETRELATLGGDAYVVALGSFTAPLLRPLGVFLNIYPTKGYSATLPLRRPEDASEVSLLDDAYKIAISRLGPEVRIAGTAEMAGYDTGLDGSTARVRCQQLVQRYEALFPGVADTSAPRFWAGLRPSTPDNRPVIGRTRLPNLWVNSGHGTLGWTHGAGSGLALAELMDGRTPPIGFRFSGARRSTAV
ncbi:MAG: D-amino acid dehydrogenase [Rhizobacter sp.]